MFEESLTQDIRPERHACTTETNDTTDPLSDGGFDILDFGLAEYAEADAERTFTT